MGWPRIEFTEEAMREGMQIESAAIPVAREIELLDALSATGIKRLLVGSFVSPKWTPQMARIEEIVNGFTPRPGVIYTALALNERGLQRAREFCPPLTMQQPVPMLNCFICDVFVQRNANHTLKSEIAAWPAIVERAARRGVKEAGIGVGAAFGSNFCGEFSPAYRFEILERQHRLWDEAGVKVTTVALSDAMSWNMPHVVERDLTRIIAQWPEVRRIYLHLHNARGMALTSIYAAMRVLDESFTLQLDCGIGGLGGCPYCGNGRVTGMAPTEDLVHMWQEMGIDTGVDLEELIRVVWLAEEIIGHKLWGHVSKCGPFPRQQRLYPVNLPFIETEEQAKHFMLGPSAIGENPLSPWKEPIRSAQRDAVEAQPAKAPETGERCTVSQVQTSGAK